MHTDRKWSIPCKLTAIGFIGIIVGGNLWFAQGFSGQPVSPALMASIWFSTGLALAGGVGMMWKHLLGIIRPGVWRSLD